MGCVPEAEAQDTLLLAGPAAAAPEGVRSSDSAVVARGVDAAVDGDAGSDSEPGQVADAVSGPPAKL